MVMIQIIRNIFIITVVIFFLNVGELGSCWLPCWCLFLVVTTHLDLVLIKVLNKFINVEVKVECTERVGMIKGQKEPDLIFCSLGFFLDISLVVLATTVSNSATKLWKCNFPMAEVSLFH